MPPRSARPPRSPPPSSWRASSAASPGPTSTSPGPHGTSTGPTPPRAARGSACGCWSSWPAAPPPASDPVGGLQRQQAQELAAQRPVADHAHPAVGHSGQGRPPPTAGRVGHAAHQRRGGQGDHVRQAPAYDQVGLARGPVLDGDRLEIEHQAHRRQVFLKAQLDLAVDLASHRGAAVYPALHQRVDAGGDAVVGDGAEPQRTSRGEGGLGHSGHGRRGACPRSGGSSRGHPLGSPALVSSRTRQWCFTDEPGGETIRWDGMPVTIVQTLRERAAARAAERGRGAARQALLLLPLLAAVLLAYVYRAELFGLDEPLRVVGLVAVVVVALYVAGFSAQELVLGGAFAAAILGLAGQQTLGNLIAGIVVLSARPFRLGDRIRLEGGMLGGNHQVEGIVSSLGLLYTTLAPDEESITVPNTALAEAEGNIIVPNNLVLASTIVPLGELAAVELHVRLPRGVRPSEIQDRVADGVSVTLRSPPEVDIEQIDAQGVMARIAARPEAKTD